MSSKPHQSNGSAPRRTKVVPKSLAELAGELSEAQRLALAVIKMTGSASLPMLTKELKLGSPFAISGVLAGLIKNLTKAGIAVDSVFIREETGKAPNRTVTYKPGPLLVGAKEELFT